MVSIKVSGLILLCFILKKCLGEFKMPTQVDYSPIHAGIKHALETSAQSDLVKPLTSNSTNLECAMPPNSIMISLSNHYTIETMALQHKAMEVWNMKECLESRMVTLCLDEICHKSCRDGSINNCVLLPIETPSADNLQEGFRYLMLLKTLVMIEALKVVEEVFFFDVDIVLFRNPWIETLHARNKDGSINKDAPRPEFMFQRELSTGLGCDGQPNGGQLYMRNTENIQKYFKKFMDNVPTMLRNNGPVDQQMMPGFIHNAGVNACAFSPFLFTSRCFGDKPTNEFRSSPVMDIVSYHTACVTGLSKKMTMLAKMYDGVKAKDPQNTFLDYLQADFQN